MNWLALGNQAKLCVRLRTMLWMLVQIVENILYILTLGYVQMYLSHYIACWSLRKALKHWREHRHTLTKEGWPV